MFRFRNLRILGGTLVTDQKFSGRGAIGGKATGPALISRKTIIGWGGIDIFNGTVLEKGHPLEGMSIKDSILILDGSKGSNGWSLFFHSAQVAGFGPAALVFPRLDSRTAVTAAVLNVPMVTDISDEIFNVIKINDTVTVDGDTGVIHLIV